MHGWGRANGRLRRSLHPCDHAMSRSPQRLLCLFTLCAIPTAVSFTTYCCTSEYHTWCSYQYEFPVFLHAFLKRSRAQFVHRTYAAMAMAALSCKPHCCLCVACLLPLPVLCTLISYLVTAAVLLCLLCCYSSVTAAAVAQGVWLSRIGTASGSRSGVSFGAVVPVHSSYDTVP